MVFAGKSLVETVDLSLFFLVLVLFSLLYVSICPKFHWFVDEYRWLYVVVRGDVELVRYARGRGSYETWKKWR